MRFLCLHGRGTNSEIMETQLAAIRHELNDGHTYDFVEGTIPAPLAPELVAFFPPDGAYYDYFSHELAETATKALSDLKQFIELEGPYGGLIAFSLGGALAATYLIREASQNPQQQLPFKCAIFFCGGAPLDAISLEENAQVSLLELDLAKPAPLKGLPTAHIWGANDGMWGDRSERLYSLCDPEERLAFVHNEGHSIPGARAKEALLGAVRIIRRTVGRVAMAV